jgi:hypothetical protein
MIEYDGILSLGAWCQVGNALCNRKLSHVYSPFHSFGIKRWQNIMDMLDARFLDYWAIENMTIGKAEENYSIKYKGVYPVYKVYDNRYNVLSNHHFDANDNTAEELLTYPEFKVRIDELVRIFLCQCSAYERVLFVCKIMSAPEPTVINRDDIRNLCTSLFKVREGKPFDLRLSVPHEIFTQVQEWIQNDGLDFIQVIPWDIEWNDEPTNAEWDLMFQNIKLVDTHEQTLKDIIGVHDPYSTHIYTLNGWVV